MASRVPTQKVTAAGLAGALSIIIVWLFGLADIDIPPEVASAFTVVLSVVTAYIVPEKADEPPQ